ncbi:hypothetical protein [Streptomyces mirabilis]|uniref:hypothetical protein n=1 Tax=Streptomyces mirabilis TaxID=68239 RepID=UPI0036EA25D4
MPLKVEGRNGVVAHGVRSKAARALGENLREKRCEVIRKEENVLAEAHPVWDVKMLPTEDDPGRRD